MNQDIAAFGQVVLIDLVLAGDNAVVIGALAANLPPAQRRVAVMAGIGCAVVARIGLSLLATWLMTIPGLVLAGGALLFWVAWKMWRDLRRHDAPEGSCATHETLWGAMGAIVLADLSMSLDNVLGVAGAARGHVPALIFGLGLSIVLMGVAASLIASVMNKHRWVGYVGLALVVFVAARMVWDGVALLT